MGVFWGVTCNKPIRVSSPYPYKSQLRLYHGRFAIYKAEFARAKTKCFFREETDLLGRDNLLHDPFIFNIWHVCVLLWVPVCNKQSVHIVHPHIGVF